MVVTDTIAPEGSVSVNVLPGVTGWPFTIFRDRSSDSGSLSLGKMALSDTRLLGMVVLESSSAHGAVLLLHPGRITIVTVARSVPSLPSDKVYVKVSSTLLVSVHSRSSNESNWPLGLYV